MAWSILNSTNFGVENVELVNDGFVIELSWGLYSEDVIAEATSKVAAYVRRLSFANEVTVRDNLVLVAFKKHVSGYWWAGAWRSKVVVDIPGKRTISRMRRTINNKMPGIAFWAMKQGVKRAASKVNHPSRTRAMGATALRHATP